MVGILLDENLIHVLQEKHLVQQKANCISQGRDQFHVRHTLENELDLIQVAILFLPSKVVTTLSEETLLIFKNTGNIGLSDEIAGKVTDNQFGDANGGRDRLPAALISIPFELSPLPSSYLWLL